jgi:hypothetical protein
MIKLVTLLKRRPGMSKADFIAYYEAHHRRIGEQVLSGYAVRYVRRYLEPADGVDQTQDFDVSMEIWFPNQAKLFDRTRVRSFLMTQESESEMPPVG